MLFAVVRKSPVLFCINFFKESFGCCLYRPKLFIFNLKSQIQARKGSPYRRRRCRGRASCRRCLFRAAFFKIHEGFAVVEVDAAHEPFEPVALDDPNAVLLARRDVVRGGRLGGFLFIFRLIDGDGWKRLPACPTRGGRAFSRFRRMRR